MARGQLTNLEYIFCTDLLDTSVNKGPADTGAVGVAEEGAGSRACHSSY